MGRTGRHAGHAAGLDDTAAEARTAMHGARYALVLDPAGQLRSYVALDRLDGDGRVTDRVRRLPAAIASDQTLKVAMGELLQHDAGWVAVLEAGTDRYLGVLTLGSLHAAIRRSVED